LAIKRFRSSAEVQRLVPINIFAEQRSVMVTRACSQMKFPETVVWLTLLLDYPLGLRMHPKHRLIKA
jgi:hypothetical protein